MLFHLYSKSHSNENNARHENRFFDPKEVEKSLQNFSEVISEHNDHFRAKSIFGDFSPEMHIFGFFLLFHSFSGDEPCIDEKILSEGSKMTKNHEKSTLLQNDRYVQK